MRHGKQQWRRVGLCWRCFPPSFDWAIAISIAEEHCHHFPFTRMSRSSVARRFCGCVFLAVTFVYIRKIFPKGHSSASVAVLHSEACCSFVRSRYTFHRVKGNLPITSPSNLLHALADEAVYHPNNVCSTSRFRTNKPNASAWALKDNSRTATATAS